jgi:hypothetical protein
MLNLFGVRLALALIAGAVLFFGAYAPFIGWLYKRNRLPVVTADVQQAIAGEKESEHAARRRQLAAAAGVK